MSHASVQLDPLNSPHPVPWNWVMATLNSSDSKTIPQVYCYRSQSLISPDGLYAAYSRIQMEVKPQFVESSISSLLFIENLVTGDLQTIAPNSPLADDPCLSIDPVTVGTISIVIPISWSETSDRLLAREFESLFCTSLASDYALVVDRSLNQIHTVAPGQIHYTNAVLLGWSQFHNSQALFRVGNLGEEEWQFCSVDMDGQTVQTQNDKPLTYGRTASCVWTGPQIHKNE